MKKIKATWSFADETHDPSVFLKKIEVNAGNLEEVIATKYHWEPDIDAT